MYILPGVYVWLGTTGRHNYDLSTVLGYVITRVVFLKKIISFICMSSVQCVVAKYIIIIIIHL